MTLVNLQRTLNLLFIYILCFIVSGGYFYQYEIHEHFCPFCLAQRLGMIGISLSLLLNLRYGLSPKYYGLAILCALGGVSISLWQIGLHFCPQFPETTAALFGLKPYTWAFLIFISSIIAIAILLMLLAQTKGKIKSFWGIGEKIAFIFLALILIFHIIFISIQCGLSTC